MKKNIAGVFGAFLLLGFFASSGWHTLGDWSTAEMVGYNGWWLFSLIGGAWFVYYGLTNRSM